LLEIVFSRIRRWRLAYAMGLPNFLAPAAARTISVSGSDICAALSPIFQPQTPGKF
jgi:hypothetical protein